jgi:hypothetical protein
MNIQKVAAVNTERGQFHILYFPNPLTNLLKHIIE